MPPDSPEEIARGLRRVLEDSTLAEILAGRARKDVEAYTWERRAEHILEALEQP